MTHPQGGEPKPGAWVLLQSLPLSLPCRLYCTESNVAMENTAFTDDFSKSNTAVLWGSSNLTTGFCPSCDEVIGEIGVVPGGITGIWVLVTAESPENGRW